MSPLEYIEHRTYDEIKVGDSATLIRTLKPQDIQLFAIMSGDVNPAHVDPEYAKSSMFREVIAHGMWGGALISTVLTSRADSAEARAASCAIALLMANAKRKQTS